MQLVNIILGGTGPILDFIATVNAGNTDPSATRYSQLNQGLYTLSGYFLDATCTFAISDQNPEQLQYIGQSGNGGPTLEIAGQSGTFNYTTGAAIVLEDSSRCVSTTLTLEAPDSSTVPAPASNLGRRLQGASPGRQLQQAGIAVSGNCSWINTSKGSQLNIQSTASGALPGALMPSLHSEQAHPTIAICLAATGSKVKQTWTHSLLSLFLVLQVWLQECWQVHSWQQCKSGCEIPKNWVQPQAPHT